MHEKRINYVCILDVSTNFAKKMSHSYLASINGKIFSFPNVIVLK